MKNTLVIIFLTLVFLFLPQSVLAIYSPLSADNNLFGIHVTDESDLTDAAKLVNGSTAQWGYVTFVIREDERDHERWQKFFNTLSSLKLIPIVRIATKIEKSNWKRPEISEASNWANFLNSLKWPILNRYVIIFNEPNHASEWGGEINPGEYAHILRSYTMAFKSKSDNFFILPAAIDASAQDSKNSTSFISFVEGMILKDNNIFKIIDGWNSHSYPNPGFSGSTQDSGRGTIKSFTWEIEYLSKFGLKKDIPVFITETGWSAETKSENDISENYAKAFLTVWNQSNIIAVTPFILDYANLPFSHFSFKNAVTGKYYKFFETIAGIPKLKGKPLRDNVSIFEQVGTIKENVIKNSIENIAQKLN